MCVCLYVSDRQTDRLNKVHSCAWELTYDSQSFIIRVMVANLGQVLGPHCVCSFGSLGLDSWPFVGLPCAGSSPAWYLSLSLLSGWWFITSCLSYLTPGLSKVGKEGESCGGVWPWLGPEFLCSRYGCQDGCLQYASVHTTHRIDVIYLPGWLTFFVNHLKTLFFFLQWN